METYTCRSRATSQISPWPVPDRWLRDAPQQRTLRCCCLPQARPPTRTGGCRRRAKLQKALGPVQLASRTGTRGEVDTASIVNEPGDVRSVRMGAPPCQGFHHESARRCGSGISNVESIVRVRTQTSPQGRSAWTPSSSRPRAIAGGGTWSSELRHVVGIRHWIAARPGCPGRCGDGGHDHSLALRLCVVDSAAVDIASLQSMLEAASIGVVRPSRL